MLIKSFAFLLALVLPCSAVMAQDGTPAHAASKLKPVPAIATGQPAIVSVKAAKIRGDSDFDDIVGYLKSGDEVVVTGALRNRWYPIKDKQGREGLVIGWALAPVPSPSPLGGKESVAIRLTKLKLDMVEAQRESSSLKAAVDEAVGLK